MVDVLWAFKEGFELALVCVCVFQRDKERENPTDPTPRYHREGARMSDEAIERTRRREGFRS